MPVVAEQHDADLVRIDVEGDAVHIAGKLDQLLEADTGQAGHLGDAGGDAGDRAHLPRLQLRREASRAWLMPAKALSKTSWRLLRCRTRSLAARRFGLGFRRRLRSSACRFAFKQLVRRPCPARQ